MVTLSSMAKMVGLVLFKTQTTVLTVYLNNNLTNLDWDKVAPTSLLRLLAPQATSKIVTVHRISIPTMEDITSSLHTKQIESAEG